MSTFKRSSLAVNAEADAVCKLLDGGFLDLYDGVQPEKVGAAITTQTRLARLQWNTPAFVMSMDGVARAQTIAADQAAAATGEATWFRAVTANGNCVFEGSVGAFDPQAKDQADLVLNKTVIVQNAIVSLSAFTYTAKKVA